MVQSEKSAVELIETLKTFWDPVVMSNLEGCENFGNGEKVGVIDSSVPLGMKEMIAVLIRGVVELSA